MKKEKLNTIKEELLTISDLNSDLIKNMTEKQLLSYTQALGVTADAFTVQKEELVGALQQMDHMQVLQWIKIIGSGLSQLHADGLVSDCEKLVSQNEDLESIRHEKLKAYVEYFLSNLTMLFADINKVLDTLQLETPEQKQDEMQPGKIKEKLGTIAELNYAKIEKMTDSQLYAYIGALHAFHDEFQAQENGLRGSIKIKHYVFVLQWLSAAEESLSKIHADSILEVCRKQISLNKDFNSIRHERLEAFVNFFLSTLSMLSADIKMLNLPKGKPKGSDDAAAESSDADKPSFEVITPGFSKSSKSILAIYKMKIFSHSLKMALGDTGYELIGINSSESALGYLKTAKPDLFILDEDLPGKGAYELTKSIREMGQMAPIIYTTSKITKDKMVKFMEVGVADFIMKPITANDVQKKVAKHFS